LGADHEDKNIRLSGVLSDANKIRIPVNYIGPQSALKDVELNSTDLKTFDILILLSGAEPQRSILEKNILDKFRSSTKKIILVRGSDKKMEVKNKTISVINFAFGKELKTLIMGADTLICRSGYSTLMDLHILNKKKIILIPTPGQPEQEYLADYWKEKFGVEMISQKSISGSKNFKI